MNALGIFVSLFLFAPSICNAQQEKTPEGVDDVIRAAASSTADPSESQQQLAAVRLRLVQKGTIARKEMERLSVDSASAKNRIDSAKFDINKLSITGISNYDIAQFNSAIDANRSRLAELQALQDSDDKRNGLATTRQNIETLERGKNIYVEIIKDEQKINENREKNTQHETELGNLENDLARVDDSIQRILRINRDLSIFTTIATVVFAFLVGFVILGFFNIANKSELVKNAIFGGDSGIQFVTLFSVVIAIILFGILRILDGKELSALLGGLSGFILGKSTTRIPPSSGSIPAPGEQATPGPPLGGQASPDGRGP
jgi:hypothetical protein